jgi:hypothetical protein
MMEKLDTLKRAVKKGDLGAKAVCWILMQLGFSNNAIQALQVRNRNYLYLKKKYSKYLMNINYEPSLATDAGSDIWICWFQGIDNAPALVKKCYESVKKYMPEKNIHVITSDNMFQYVDFPDYIIEKWHKGIISNTHLSDILRLELLIRYGGLWLDATVLLTGRIPEYIFRNNLFMYTRSNKSDLTMSYNNWLIFAHKDNRILKTSRDMMYEFWRREKKVREYFVWHLFMTMIKEKYPDDFRDIPYVADELPEALARFCFEQKDEKFLKELSDMTPVHKLSNRLKVPENISGTYYEWILQ